MAYVDARSTYRVNKSGNCCATIIMQDVQKIAARMNIRFADPYIKFSAVDLCAGIKKEIERNENNPRNKRPIPEMPVPGYIFNRAAQIAYNNLSADPDYYSYLPQIETEPTALHVSARGIKMKARVKSNPRKITKNE